MTTESSKTLTLSEAEALADKLARDIMAAGDGPTPCCRIQFKGGIYPDNEIDQGGCCESALSKFIFESLISHSKKGTADLLEVEPSQKRFRPPTLEEVKLVTAKTGLPESDAVWFWNKCEGNGWTNGGEKIKRWPNVIAAWKAAGYMPSQKFKQQVMPQPQRELPGARAIAEWKARKACEEAELATEIELEANV